MEAGPQNFGNREPQVVLRPTPAPASKPSTRGHVAEQLAKQQQHQMAAAQGAVTQHKPFTPKATKHRPRPVDLNASGVPTQSPPTRKVPEKIEKP